jgi:hypothetical protein
MSLWADGLWAEGLWADGLWAVDAPAAPTITTVTLSPGRLGFPYTVSLSASGTTPITWEVTTGSLPDGLSLGTDGVFSGTPTTAETQVFTVTATNSEGTDTQELSLTISNRRGGSKRRYVYESTIPQAKPDLDAFKKWLNKVK